MMPLSGPTLEGAAMPDVDEFVGRILEIAPVSGSNVSIQALMAADAYLAAFPATHAESERARLLALLAIRSAAPRTEAVEQAILAIKAGGQRPDEDTSAVPRGFPRTTMPAGFTATLVERATPAAYSNATWHCSWRLKEERPTPLGSAAPPQGRCSLPLKSQPAGNEDRYSGRNPDRC
jgi:hypothetical protein